MTNAEAHRLAREDGVSRWRYTLVRRPAPADGEVLEDELWRAVAHLRHLPRLACRCRRVATAAPGRYR